MGYRNKTYVAFDADNDIRYYNLMTAWKQNDNTSFDFYNAHDLINIWQQSSEETIKRNLRERLNNTKVFVLLVGDKTKYLYKYVRWEIEQALKMELPIIVVNLNGSRFLDEEKCPALLKDELVLHVSFNGRIIQEALENWTSKGPQLRVQGNNGPYYYNSEVYSNLGL